MSARDFLIGLPNIITVGRLMLVPVTVALITAGRWPEAFAAFTFAGLSDAVDGFIARHFDLRTELGAYLDPLADKALLVSIYIALSLDGVLPRTLVILVVSRDLMIVGAVIVSWVLEKPVEIRPLLVSKLNTTAQITLACAVLGARAFGLSLDGWVPALQWIVAALTIASMAAYLDQWLRHMNA
jgi:cardiolipin synthase